MKLKIFNIIDNNSIIIYYSYELLTLEQINTKSISYIHYIYDINSAIMIFLKTKKKYRKNGLAKNLIKESIKILKKMKVKKIELDDMSVYSRTEKSIYKKFGFEYINPYPEPEMILYL